MAPHAKIEMLRVGVGLLLLGYAAYCVVRGRITARVLGARARPVLRSEDSTFFWFVICCQIIVAVAIMFVPPGPMW